MFRTRRLAASLTAAALLTTGCIGGSGSGTSASPLEGLPAVDLEATDAMLIAAVDRTNEVSSFRFAMLISFSVEELDWGEMRFEVDGVMDSTTGEAEFTMDMSSLFASVPSNQRGLIEQMFGDGKIEYVQSGGKAYMKVPGLLNGYPGDAEWVSIPIESSADAMGALGVAFENPTSMLAELQADSDVTEVGREVVGGIETTRFQVSLASEDLDPTGFFNGDLPLSVWIDDQGVLRRVELQFDAAGMSGGMVMQISDFGVDVNVDVPKNFVEIDPAQFG